MNHDRRGHERKRDNALIVLSTCLVLFEQIVARCYVLGYDLNKPGWGPVVVFLVGFGAIVAFIVFCNYVVLAKGRKGDNTIVGSLVLTALVFCGLYIIGTIQLWADPYAEMPLYMLQIFPAASFGIGALPVLLLRPGKETSSHSLVE